MSKPAGPDLVIGRKSEIGVLRGLVDAVVAGRGGVAWVEGEPGIGKSTLIAAGLANAAERGCDVYWSMADELTRRLPLRAILDCLQITHLGPADPVRADIMPAPYGGGGGLPQTGDPVSGAGERVLELVERRCATAPVVLVIDDLHQADADSLEVWGRLAALAHQLPLLLVAALRPAARRTELRRLRHDLTRLDASIITLGPLTTQDVADLATHLIGAPPGDRLRDLLGRAGGNPLYVTEVVQAVQRDNLIQVQPTTAQRAVAEIPVVVGPDRLPASLATAITDRLAIVHADSVPVLRMAALLGTDCTESDLATALDEPVEWLAPVIADAIAAGILVASGPHITFRHPLLREAVAARLPRGDRIALLRQAAQALAQAGAAAPRVAAYLLEATDVVDTWMIEWLASTAPDLVQQTPTVAQELLDRALATLIDDDPRRDPLEIALLHLHFVQGQNDRSQHLAQRLLHRVDDPDRAAEIAWILAYTLMRLGQADAGLTVAEEMTARPGLTLRWQARLQTVTATGLSEMGRLDDADRLARAALELAERAEDRAAKGWALRVRSGVAGKHGEFARALSMSEDALEAVGADPRLTDLRLMLLNGRLVELLNLDRLQEVDLGLRELLRLGERAGAARLKTIRILAANYYFYVGRWDDAIAELAAVGELTSVHMLYRHHGFAAMIAARRNDRDTAARLLAEVNLDLDTPGFVRSLSTWLLIAQAMLAERAGTPQLGVAALGPVLIPEGDEFFDDLSLALPLLVRLALATGDAATATAGAAVADAYAARQSTTVSTAAAAAHCHGLLANDPLPLLDAATRVRERGWQVQLADILADAAVLLATRGDLDQARTTHAEAYQLLDSFGAEWDIRRLESRLRPLGIRREERGPRRPRTGWNALTRTEQRVAQLVTTGLSNPDIANELVMSRRTVQTHVSNILTKLNARSRAEIAHHATTHDTHTAAG